MQHQSVKAYSNIQQETTSQRAAASQKGMYSDQMSALIDPLSSVGGEAEPKIGPVIVQVDKKWTDTTQLRVEGQKTP